MSWNYFWDVWDFHHKHGLTKTVPNPDIREAPDRNLIRSRARLITEEADETREALHLYAIHPTDQNLYGLAKELADLLYVTFGACVELGIPIGDVWAKVHESNMGKDGGRREDGKVLKGTGYVEPDLSEVMK